MKQEFLLSVLKFILKSDDFPVQQVILEGRGKIPMNFNALIDELNAQWILRSTMMVLPSACGFVCEYMVKGREVLVLYLGEKKVNACNDPGSATI